MWLWSHWKVQSLVVDGGCTVFRPSSNTFTRSRDQLNFLLMASDVLSIDHLRGGTVSHRPCELMFLVCYIFSTALQKSILEGHYSWESMSLSLRSLVGHVLLESVGEINFPSSKQASPTSPTSPASQKSRHECRVTISILP